MNKILKKSLILLMVLVLAFSVVLTGCGNENNNEVTTVENNIQVEVSTDDAVVSNEEAIDEIVEYGDFKGYLWEIKHDGATVYLFGSIHIANEGLYPFHEDVEKAYESSDILGVEADITDMNAIQDLASMMAYKDSDTVYDHLSEDGILKFEEICEELNIKPMMFQKLKVWALGSNLMALQLANGGYSGAEGIDLHFINRAKDNKEIVELEGIKFQFDMMNNLTDEQQEATFITSLGTIEETLAAFDELYESFKTEDVDLVTEFLFASSEDEGAFEAEVEKIILHDRNIGMADKIDEYLQTDKTYFIIVGLAHYLGEDSVIKFLEEKGYEINRK